VQAGDGDITRATRSVPPFTRIRAELAGDVVIEEGSESLVQVETDSNLQDIVTTSVEGDTLVLSTRANVAVCFNQLRVVVGLPAFEGASLDGTGDVSIEKPSPGAAVSLSLSGTGDLTFRGSADTLTIDLSGTGSVHLTDGSASETSITLSGVGDVDGARFTPGRLSKDVTGVGDVSF
jgi:hypothetical protein